MARKVRYLFLIFGLVFFFYLVFDLGLRNILTNIQKTGWWFLMVIATWGLVYLCNTLSWRVILGRDKKLFTLGELYQITLSSFAINYITPFMNLGGEPFRVLAIRDKVGNRSAISMTILFRLLHSLAHVIFLLFSFVMVLVYLPISASLRPYLLLTFFVLIALLCAFLLTHRHGILEPLLKLLLKAPFLEGLAAKLKNKQEAVQEIDAKIRELYRQRPKDFLLALSFELACRFIMSLEFFFILTAIGAKVSVLDAFYINAASSLIMNVLFFVPFELGAREGSLYLIMESLHVVPGVGVFIALVNRIRELFWILIGLGLVQFTRSRVRSEDPDALPAQSRYDSQHTF